MEHKISELLNWDDSDALSELSDVLRRLDGILAPSEKEEWIKSFIEDLTDTCVRINLKNDMIYFESEPDLMRVARDAAKLQNCYDSKSSNGQWGQHADYPMKDWRHEAGNGDTRLGYWEWVIHRIESEAVT